MASGKRILLAGIVLLLLMNVTAAQEFECITGIYTSGKFIYDFATRNVKFRQLYKYLPAAGIYYCFTSAGKSA